MLRFIIIKSNIFKNNIRQLLTLGNGNRTVKLLRKIQYHMNKSIARKMLIDVVALEAIYEQLLLGFG